MTISIRPAKVPDAERIAAIHNQGIVEREATFDTEPRAAADLGEELAAPETPPFLVAVDPDGAVVGWARLSPYSSRPCYAGVGEASLYVDRAARGQGVGRTLVEALAADAEGRGYWKLVGLLFPTNAASVALCRAAGWRDVGVFRRHGRLEERWRDVLVMEQLLGEARDA